MGKPRAKPNNDDSKKKIPKRKKNMSDTDGKQTEQPPKKPKSALRLFKERLLKYKPIEVVPLFGKKQYAHMIANTEKTKNNQFPKERGTFEEMISGMDRTGTVTIKQKEPKKKKVPKPESL